MNNENKSESSDVPKSPIHNRKPCEGWPDIREEDIFQCPACKEWHKRWDYKTIYSKCDDCYEFGTKNIIKDNMDLPDAAYYCGKCHTMHYASHKFYIHYKYKMDRINDIRKKIKCNMCNKEYLNKSSLNRHMSSHH